MFTDINGEPLEPGDWIAYALRTRSAGNVCQIVTRLETINRARKDHRGKHNGRLGFRAADDQLRVLRAPEERALKL